LLVVPISAHALFARPLVTSPEAEIAVEVLPATAKGGALLWCDGRRVTQLQPGSRVEVRQGTQPVRLAHLRDRPFTDRLVAKFSLPVTGWRGATETGSA
jgi:NAD+ kinase